MPGFMDALGEIGYALDTPGAYFRGALAGRPGERASGRDLLSTYGLTDESDPLGGLKGFGAEAVLDPLSLLGPAAGAFKGIQGLTRGSRALAGLGDAAPLARRLGELGAGVDTPLDAIRHASRQGESANPMMRAIAGFVGDEGGWMKYPLRLGDRQLNRQADALGPMYPGGLDKLRGVLGSQAPTGTTNEALYKLWDQIVRRPDLNDPARFERLAAELPEGSRVLGHGMESVVFGSPEGSAIRYGPRMSDFAPDFSPRPIIPEVLQPYRVADLGDDYVAEHLPLVTPMDAGRGIDRTSMNRAINGALGETRTAGDNVRRAADVLKHNLEGPGSILDESILENYPGANPWDTSPGNIGITPEGRALVMDGGAISHNSMLDRAPFPYHKADHTHHQLDPELVSRLIGMNTPEMVRQSMARGLASGTVGQGLALHPLWAKRLEVAMQKYGLAARPYLDPGMPIESDVLKLFQGR